MKLWGAQAHLARWICLQLIARGANGMTGVIAPSVPDRASALAASAHTTGTEESHARLMAWSQNMPGRPKRAQRGSATRHPTAVGVSGQSGATAATSVDQAPAHANVTSI